LLVLTFQSYFIYVSFKSFLKFILTIQFFFYFRLKMIIYPLLTFTLLLNCANGIIWQAGDWAFACDFKGGDVGNAQISGADCGGRCGSTSGCTHFTWTTYNGGTCWMKGGGVSKADAFDTGDQSMVCGIVSGGTSNTGVNWNGNDWAFACDFPGGDIGNAQIRGEDCGGRCSSTSGCTHFTWTTYNGGTCWMKGGTVSKSQAVSTSDQTMVCGIVGSTPVPPTPSGRCSDYGALIELSTQFYEAQRSGRLPANRRVTWRKDSAVNDRGNNGEDLSGGYYDGQTMI
jgi:hypothetical protein